MIGTIIVFGIFYLLLGIFILISIHIVQGVRDLLKHGIAGNGTVVDIVLQRNNGKSHYHPEFEFEYKGKTYRVISRMGSWPSDYSIGDRIQVLIHTKNPMKSEIKSFAAQWGGAMIAVGLTTAMLVMLTAVFLKQLGLY